MRAHVVSSLLAALLLCVLAAAAPRVGAAEALPPTLVTAAGAGVFPGGAQLSGVNLSGGSFGQGLAVSADGNARGDFQTILAGTNLLGAATKILVVGWVTGGTVNPDGSVSVSGTCRLDMQDGTLPSTGVPFAATITTGGFRLTIGTSVLPPLVKNAGWIFIE
jgi:hypothetical protein